MSAFKEVATVIKEVFDVEFASEQYVMVFDDIHESMGRRRVDVGISPLEDVVDGRNNVVQQTYVEVKFFHLWDERIDPETVVNPVAITEYADRFRRALRTARTTATATAWFFNVERVQYPRDPTGNKTRFVMTICAYGNNTALVETGA